MTIDYSKPLATLLREGTKDAHEAVEGSQGVKLLLSGTLAKGEFVKYLMMLWHVYDTLEQALDKHAAHPCLEPTYNPALLVRAPSLSADIAHLLDVDEQSWKSHPVYTSLTTPSLPKPLADYVSRIQHLSSTDPAPLLAHAYVRYLGDLSGGQNMKRILAKAYDIDEHEGEGLSFFSFKELKTNKTAGLGEMKRIKEWYREGMNVAGDAAPDSKPAIVAEASTAFRLNAGLFDTLQNLSLQDEREASARTKGKGVAKSPDDTVTNIPGSANAGPTTYQLSSVLAVVAAVCIAHFCLVVGGFTGNAGYEKLLAVEEWITKFWQQSSGSK